MKLRYPDTFSIIGNNNSIIKDNNSVLFNCSIANEALHISIKSDTMPLCFIKLTWTLSKEDIYNRKQIKVLGDAWERGYGDFEWSAPCADKLMPWYFMISNGSDSVPDSIGRITECFGVKVRPSAFCGWQYSESEIILTLDIRNGGTGIILGGRTLNVADIIFSEYKNISAYDAACRFCMEMNPVPTLPTSPIFGFNDWYFSYGTSNKDLILDSAKMLTNKSSDYANTPYMVIDDGWQINFNDGPWHLFNPDFGNIEDIASRITEMGAHPGIWIRPLQQKTRDDSIPNSWRSKYNPDALDPSKPEVLDYIGTCIRRITNWGFKLIKYDFVTYDIFLKWGFECNGFMANDNWNFYDTSKTTAEIIVNLYSVIRQAAPSTVLIGCNAVSHLCAGLVDLNRTGDDTSGKEWERTLKMGVNTLAFRSPQNNAFYIADADCAGITENIPFSLNKKWLYALSVSGSPMFVSVSPRNTTDEVVEEIHKALIRNSAQNDTMIPLDWMETKTPCRWRLNGQEILIDWNEI